MNNLEDKKAKERPDDNIWKVALGIVCVGILAYGFFYSKNRTSNVAYLIGANLPVALLVWGMFCIAGARKHGSTVVGFSFLAIFVSLIGGELIGFSQQKQEALRAVTEIQDQFSALVESSVDGQGIPKRIEERIDTEPKARGEFGEVEKFVKEFMDHMVSQRNDYLLELEAIGWNSILDTNRIKADTTFIEGRVIIKKAKEVIKKYEEETSALLSSGSERIRSLKISESSKRVMQSSYGRGMEKSRINRYFPYNFCSRPSRVSLISIPCLQAPSRSLWLP